MTYETFDKVEATFRPKRADTLLRPGKGKGLIPDQTIPQLVPQAGHRYVWECYGEMEEGVYAGQTIWCAIDGGVFTRLLPSLWVPWEDLADVMDAPGLAGGEDVGPEAARRAGFGGGHSGV